MTNIIEKVKEEIKKGEEIVEKVVKEVEDEVKKITDSKEPKNKKTPEKKKVSKKSEEKDLAKKAEKEATDKELEKKKKELLEKAAKLKEKIETADTKELKEKIRIKKREDMLIPLEEYVKSGIYIGTRVVTPNMRPFVYRRRADGLAIFNTDLIDKMIREGTEYLSKFNPSGIILACKRQSGWKAAKMFSELTGIKIFTKKYPAGVLTNTALPDFFENELTIICDSWLDKNALKDTLLVRKKVLMICDTNNFSKGADQVIIGNNKSEKSLGVIFYLLTKGYMKARKMDTSKIPDLEYWTGEKE